MANIIGVFKNEAGAVFKDESVTLNVQQNFGGRSNPVEENVEIDDTEVKRAESFTRIDLIRVFLALHKAGAFESRSGGHVSQAAVFRALTSMLGEDFTNYSRDLYDASSTKNGDKIFDELNIFYQKYEADKLKGQNGKK